MRKHGFFQVVATPLGIAIALTACASPNAAAPPGPTRSTAAAPQIPRLPAPPATVAAASGQVEDNAPARPHASAPTAVPAADLPPTRLAGEAAERAAAVLAQLPTVDISRVHDQLKAIFGELVRHGVLRDQTEVRGVHELLCPSGERSADRARCLLDVVVWAQESLIDGARLGAWRQPLPPHRKHFTAEERAERQSVQDADRARGVRQALALLAPGDRGAEGHLQRWLEEAGPGRFVQYPQLVEALARYRDLATQAVPPLPSDLPVAGKDAWRKHDARDDFLRQLTSAHRDALRRRLCFEGYCSPEPQASMPAAAVAAAPQQPASRRPRPRSVAAAPLDDALAARLRAWQHDRGLRPSALIDAETLAALRVPMRARVQQIRLALQRIRDTRVGGSDNFLVANIPAFRLDVYREGKLARSHLTQVGKGTKKVRRKGRWLWVPGHRTPLMSTKLRNLVLNPEWVVPSSIKREFRFKVARDPQWYAKNGFEVRIASNGGEALVMKSGPENLLGVVKFLFPNTHLVYLHDTPAKRYFKDPRRLKSHGCVRVQDAEGLARYLLAQDRGAPISDKKWEKMLEKYHNQWMGLSEPLDIHLAYWTADVSNEGKVRFYPDVYRFDEADRRIAQREVMERIDTRPDSVRRQMPAGPAQPACPVGARGGSGECP